jgi:hypothetical protein
LTTPNSLELARDPARRPKRSLTFDHPEQPQTRSRPGPKAGTITRSQLQQTSSRSIATRPEGRTTLSLSAAANVLEIDRDPTRRPNHSLTLSRSKRPRDRSRPDPKAEPLSHSQTQQTSSRSIATRPESRTTLSLSDVTNALKIDHEPPRRVDRSLTLRRGKSPSGSLTSHPEGWTDHSPLAAANVLQLAHTPTRKPERSRVFGHPRATSEPLTLQPESQSDREPLGCPQTSSRSITLRPESRNGHYPSAVRFASPRGPLDPHGGVRPPRTHSALGSASSADSDPLRGPDRAVSRRRLSFHDLGVAGEPGPSGLRSIEVRRKRQFSANEELSTSLGFFASSTTSRL